MTQASLSPRAWTELLLLALIWGGSFLSIRIALDEIGPLTSVLHRTGWAIIVLWAAVLVTRARVPKSPRVWAACFVMGLLNNVLPFTLMAWGQLVIPSGLTSILNAATAIFGVVLASVFFADERLTGHRFLGVVLGFGGVVTVIGWRDVLAFDITSLAQLAVLAGTMCYACASVWARKYLRGIPPLVAAAGMLTGSTLVMAVVVPLTEGWPSLALHPQTWAAIGYYALAATALAYLLYYRVLATAGSGNLMLVTLLIPPVAITLGATLRDETLGPKAFAGFALLACGLALIDGRLPQLAKRLTRPAH